MGTHGPSRPPHARVAYLLKEGAELGHGMNYRPLTIASPLYRCWGTCRLEDMHMWVQMWALDETYAGVPGREAVDAWREVLTALEELRTLPKSSTKSGSCSRRDA